MPSRQRANLPGRPASAVDWQQADLEDAWPDWGLFDAVLVFNYLDRPRFPRAREAVRKGGLLIVESFLTTQREQGWGPTADAHLLLPGELARLVAPFEIMHGREVAEPVDTERWRHVASVLRAEYRLTKSNEAPSACLSR